MAKTRILGEKIPLAVSWALTFRCNQQCLYCGIWQNQCRELRTPEVLYILEQFKKLGTRWISFTGGEPLLREDIGEIIRYAKKSGIYVSINSNGRLVPEKINQLQGADRIKLSLDGPPEINDRVRGQGSFRAVEEAVRICRESNIYVCLECVLSKDNLKSVDWILDFALAHHLKVLFQPAIKKLLWTDKPNPAAAPLSGYRQTIKRLIKKKKERAPILNSLAGLRHIYHWPEPRRIYCSGGLLNFDLEPDGTLLACDRAYRRLSNGPGENTDAKRALRKIRPVRNCRHCWCSSLVEFNLVASFNPNAAINFLKNN